MSVALSPVVAHYYPEHAPSTAPLPLRIAREATAGVFVGAMARCIMSALQTARTLISAQ